MTVGCGPAGARRGGPSKVRGEAGDVKQLVSGE